MAETARVDDEEERLPLPPETSPLSPPPDRPDVPGDLSGEGRFDFVPPRRIESQPCELESPAGSSDRQ